MENVMQVQWHLICRICLQEGDMFSIYDKDENNIMICDKIMKCSNITIKSGKNLPQQICNSCLNDLNAAYRFFTNCENSEAILQSLVDNDACQTSTEITDLIVSSENGNVYKYKPPAGLNVKRIKASSSSLTPSNTIVHQDQKIKVESVIIPESTENIEELIEDHFVDDDDYDDNNVIIEEINLIEEQPKEEEDGKPKIAILRRGRSSKRKDENEKECEMIESENVTTIKPVKCYKRRSTGINKTTTKATTQKKVKILPAEDVIMNPDGTTVIRVRKSEMEKPKKICEICGNTYKYKHALESHMRRHRNEKPFACEICGRAFVINFELRRHMRTHTGQKPYMCRYCGRRFSDFGSRIKHERTHTGERPYVCETCGKAFSYSHVLQSHILTHTGEKRFECTLCGKRFTKSHHLKAHMNTHTKNKNKAVIKQEEEKPQITTIIAPNNSNWVATAATSNLNEIQQNDNIEIEQKVFIQPTDGKIYVHENKVFIIKEKKEEENLSFSQLC